MLRALAAAILIPCCLWGEIQPLESLKDLPEIAEQGSVVFLQLDDVLVTSTTSLGASDWLPYRVKKRMDAGVSYRDAVLEELPLYMEIQRKTELQAVEPGTANVVKEIREKLGCVFGLTWRPPSLYSCTLDQLENLGIDFGGCQDCDLDVKYLARITGHVLFTGVFNRQSTVILQFLQILAHQPDRVIVIDVKRERLEEFSNALAGTDIPFLGLHYTHEKPPEAAFNAELAETQLKVFGTILNDTDAQRLIELKLF